jgi:hypothetical protein
MPAAGRERPGHDIRRMTKVQYHARPHIVEVAPRAGMIMKRRGR